MAFKRDRTAYVCVWLEPTGRSRDIVTFHGPGPSCEKSPGRLCSSELVIQEVEENSKLPIALAEDVRDEDVPKTCAWCGGPVGTTWKSAHRAPIYRRSDTGELITLDHAPIGSLWDADWYPEERKHADGRYLVCRTPAGDWCIDGKSYNGKVSGPGWTRTGDPTKPETLTVHPSIGIGEKQDDGDWKFHGWLRAGKLTPV